MKKLFNTNFNHGGVHFMLLVVRVVIAGCMLYHGYPKFQQLIAGGEIKFADPIGIGTTASFVLTVFSEFFCSLLLLFGLATRLATIPLIISMLVIILIVHGPDTFDIKELAVHYLLVYLLLLVAGPGKYSIDRLISGNTSRRRR